MYFQILFMLSFLSLPLNHSLNHEIMDEEIPKSELPKPFRKLSIRVNKSHLPVTRAIREASYGNVRSASMTSPPVS